MRSLVVLSGLLLAAAPAPAADWSQLSGQFSRITEHRAVVVTTAAEWRRLWMDHTGGAPDSPLPEADFTREVVAAVFAGTRRTTGHSVIMDVRRNVAEDSIKVVYTVRPADPDGFHHPTLTQPFMLRKLPKPAGPVTLERADKLGAALEKTLSSPVRFE